MPAIYNKPIACYSYNVMGYIRQNQKLMSFEGQGIGLAKCVPTLQKKEQKEVCLINYG